MARRKGTGASVSSQRPPQLLLIEDHADLANATAEFLRLLGMDVQIAGSGNQALKVAPAFRPAIVLCDLFLPDMSGLEVVRRLRADPKTKHALFAVCTATDIDELEEDFASEVDLFLSKPITNSEVDELLNRIAARRATMFFGSEEKVP